MRAGCTAALAAATMLQGSMAFTLLPSQPGMVRYSTFTSTLAAPAAGTRKQAGSRLTMSHLASPGVAVAKATAAVAAPLAAALPTTQVLVAACTIPTLLGYWKSEYGVSYA